MCPLVRPARNGARTPVWRARLSGFTASSILLSVLPTEDDVLSHGFDIRPAWWQSRVPGQWSAFLSELPDSAHGRGYHRITRADLFALAQDRSPHGSGTLLVACYAWGTGSSGWLVPRRARVFRDTPLSVLGGRLADARRILYTDGPEAAFESLSDGAPNRTKHMRASFFTKFLYAADAESPRPSGCALILDQFVAVAVNDLHGWGLRERGPWSAETYGNWIALAEREAKAASDPDRAVRPDAVEMAYFERGKQLSAERRT